MNKDNLISVILPVYNAEKYLAMTIESVLNQTYTSFEFIIIDDGSSDKSFSIIKEYAKIDKRIICIHRENKGVVYTLNEALSHAKGEYIAKIDHDDICMHNRLEIQLREMENRNLDICGGHYITINNNNKILDIYTVPINHDMCILSLSAKVPFAHPSVMMKKSFIKKNKLSYGMGPSVVSEDLDLWNEFYKAGAIFGNVDAVIIKYRILENSISRLGHKTILKETKYIVKYFVKENSKILKKLLSKHHSSLNKEEETIIAYTVFKLFLYTFDIKSIKYLRKINKKILLCTFFSFLKNL